MQEYVFRTENLSKYFGQVEAVKSVNIGVPRGEVFGFLGPNGAGKTTTIGMALGLIRPTAGRVELFGQLVSPDHVRPLRRVGSLMGRPALLPYASGLVNLQLLARLHEGVKPARIGQVLEQVGLVHAAHRKVNTYSTGMKQRLGLAAAILNQPSLVILDEPTNGLDPAGMREVRNLIRSLAAEGTTVFLSSHLLHEVEQVCDRIAVIHHGQIIARGSVEELLRQKEAAVRVRVASTSRAVEALRAVPGVTSIEADGAYVEIRGAPSERIVAHLARHDLPPAEVTLQKSDLESLFLGLTEA